MLWHQAGGLGARVTFELLLIKGWCSQVSSSEQDLVTQVGEITPLSQLTLKQQSCWPFPANSCRQMSEDKWALWPAQFSQRKEKQGELSMQLLPSSIDVCATRILMFLHAWIRHFGNFLPSIENFGLRGSCCKQWESSSLTTCGSKPPAFDNLLRSWGAQRG